MNQFEVIAYVKENGISPVLTFIQELPGKLQSKTVRDLDLLEEFGTVPRGKSIKMLEDGIFELRVKQSSNIVRVLYFFRSGKKIILTNGFVKKDQKTPRSEIELAKKYRADYLSREEKS